MSTYKYTPERMRDVAVAIEAVRQAAAGRAGLIAEMPLPPKLHGHPLWGDIKGLQRQIKVHATSGSNVLNNVAAELRVRANLAELADLGITAKTYKKWKQGKGKLPEVPKWFKELGPRAQELLLAYGTHASFSGGRLKSRWELQPDGTKKFKVGGPEKEFDRGRETRKSLAGKIADKLGKLNNLAGVYDDVKTVYEAFGTKGGLDDKAKAVLKVLVDKAVDHGGTTAGTVLLGGAALALGGGPAIVVLAGLLGGWAGAKAAEFLADKIGKPVLNLIKDLGGAIGDGLEWLAGKLGSVF